MPETDSNQRQFAAIDRQVAAAMAAEHIPGLSLAVNRGGRAWLRRGYGQANLELGTPATADSVFEIASITKLFTTVAVLMLVEDGLLTLDDPLGRHLADLPSAWAAVPIHRILAHQSGIPSYTEADGYWEGAGRDRSRAETVDLVRHLPLRFAPGEHYSYDNTGFYLLGLLVEAVGGQDYGDFLAARVFQPLEMTRTRANDYGTVVPGRADGYRWDGGVYVNRPYYSLSNTFSAGCLLSTAADLALWDLALDGDRLLPRHSLEAMWTPRPSRSGNEMDAGFQVGLGWFVLERSGRRMVAHNGGILGFSSSYLRFVDDRVSVVLLTNAGHLAEPYVLAEQLATLCLEAPAPAGS